MTRIWVQPVVQGITAVLDFKAYLILLLIQLAPVYTIAQFTDSQRNFINKEILFVNESIHGLLVAHRLYENYNQEMNKFVDLPRHNLNNLGGADIPDDIFSDPNKWFYDRSPAILYNELLIDPARSSVSTPWSVMSLFRNEITIINNDRKRIDRRIAAEDLNNLNTVLAIYKDLESSVRNYEEFRSGVISFERSILELYHDAELTADRKQVYTALVELHFEFKNILRNIRLDNQSGVINSYGKYEKEIKWLDQCIRELKIFEEQQGFSKILQILLLLSNDINEYINNPQVPEEYNLLGKSYYYHNVRMLTRLNRYGNGYASELNKLFDGFGWNVLHFMEEPHYLKMIYPQRIQVENRVKESSGSPRPVSVDSSALKIKVNTSSNETLHQEPPVIAPPLIVSNKSLRVDTTVFEIELYDHRIKDGDQISINVNGEWLFYGISLEKEAKRIVLSVLPGEDNYIIIKAENEGWRPPNTFGMRYISRGRSENVFVKQDLKTGEAVRISYSL